MKAPVLIENWHKELLRLWRSRPALAIAAAAGLYLAWPAFQDVINPYVFAAVAVILSVVVVAGHILEKPEASDADE